MDLEVILDSGYSTNSVDNKFSYRIVHDYAKEFKASSQFGLFLRYQNKIINSMIILGGGGATIIHPNSIVVVRDNLFLAIGDRIVAINISELKISWSIIVDSATCFGVYFRLCVISCGYLLGRVSPR